MKAMQGVVAALVLLAAGAQARQPDVDGIRHWSTPAFEVYSPDTNQARTVSEQVAPIERVLSMVLGKEVEPTGVPTWIYIAPQAVWHRYLRPSDSIAAEFVPGRFANYILMEAYVNNVWARETLRHEYAHFFLRTQYGGVLPLWFDEGVAEIAGHSDILSKQVRIGLPVITHGTWIPLDRLLRADKKSPEYLSHQTTNAFHFQSWALVHRGMFHDRDFGRQILAYVRAINAGVPIDEAVQASFGMSVAELDRALAGYTKRRSFRIGKFPVDWPPKVELGAGRRVGELEALEQLARIMFDTGLNPTRLGEVIAAAQKLAPESAAVRVLALRLAARDGSDADIENAWRALEPQTADPVVARAAGLALFEGLRAEILSEIPPGHALAARARRAFDLLSRGEHALPVDAEAAWAFGLLSALLGLESEFALQRIKAAGAAVPRNGDLSMTQAMLHQRLEQPGEMREQLLHTVRHARTQRQILWARQRLELVPDTRQP
jgi:hypothetical protein